MRVPVFSFRSNPSTDSWLCKKSLSYAERCVADRTADWLIPSTPHLGIILRGHFNVRNSEASTLNLVAGSGFDSAWGKKQSGFGGPLVWQLKTERALTQ